MKNNELNVYKKGVGEKKNTPCKFQTYFEICMVKFIEISYFSREDTF